MFGPKNDLELLKKQLESFPPTDDKAVRDLVAVDYFVSRILFNRVNSEWEIQGCSFSQRGPLVLLVVKGTHEETQYVAFITEQNPTRCMVTFARQWLEGRVKWHEDKYAKT